jgi:hypothetical protein
VTATQRDLLDRFGVLLNYEQLATVMKRRPDGLRICLSQDNKQWAKKVNAAKVRFGRRVLFRTADIARVIEEGGVEG